VKARNVEIGGREEKRFLYTYYLKAIRKKKYQEERPEPLYSPNEGAAEGKSQSCLRLRM